MLPIFLIQLVVPSSIRSPYCSTKMAASLISPPRRPAHPRVAVVCLHSSIFGLQTGFINLCLKNVSFLPLASDVYSSYIYHPRFVHLFIPTVSRLLPIRGPSNPHFSSHSPAADHFGERSQISGYQIFNVRIKYDSIIDCSFTN